MRVRPLLALALVTGCADGSVTPEPETASTDQAVVGLEGTLEFALDAPWRLDPIGGQGADLEYPPIPIQISFFDEHLWEADTCWQGTGCPLMPGKKRLGDFCGLAVTLYDGEEPVSETYYDFDELADVERIGGTVDGAGAIFWPFPDSGDEPVPQPEVCQPAVETCSDAMPSIRNTSGWHARADHELAADPGTKVLLELEGYVSKEPGECDDADQLITFRNWVNVLFAPAALPRFDNDWLYADLHYHSQGTDNEGEVGYNYRGVLAAQAAIGIDVVFATEHASASEQFVDIDIGIVGEAPFLGPEGTRQGARDMTSRRFDIHRDDYIEGPLGANTLSSAIWTYERPVHPRIFLGGEVDVKPVVTTIPTTPHNYTYLNGNLVPVTNPETAWYVQYGNPNYDNDKGLRFDLWNMCEGWMGALDPFDSCPGHMSPPDEMFTPFVHDGTGQQAWWVHDLQGPNDTQYFARQHMIYLPASKEVVDGFVGSYTSEYGGATRDLDHDDGVADDVGARGIAFLAHPHAGGGNGPGPGYAPYSAFQLERAFEHPAIAGLQFWNENKRLESKKRGDCVPPLGPNGPILDDPEFQFCIENDWDEEGYDHIGTLTNGSGHTPGWYNEEFELVPQYDLFSWTWQSRVHGVDHDLHHGAYAWDRMLRWGLDLGRTSELAWLPSGEPRKVFMAGGSDAHGDFNYRREGYMTGPSGTSDVALGKVRNLVLAGPAEPGRGEEATDDMPHTQDQIVRALRGGRFSITDGPALNLVLDTNQNGVHDDGEPIMGDTMWLTAEELTRLPLIVEWKTTTEFGAIHRIDLYVGVDGGVPPTGSGLPPMDPIRARTFAPVGHGVRREANELTEEQVDDGWKRDPVANDCDDENDPNDDICEMQDGYWLPGPEERAKLRITPAGAEITQKKGARPWVLDLTKFPIASGPGKRFYVRAFAMTRPKDTRCTLPLTDATRQRAEREGVCIRRYAFTNPVWAIQRDFTTECPYLPSSFDRDGDGLPDSCDGNPDVATAGWSMRGGGLDIDDATAVAHAADGDVFVAGNFRGTAQIEGYDWITADGVSQDGYVARYAAETPTSALWLQQLRGTGNVTVTDLVVASDGDVVVTGWFGGQLMVDTQNVFTATSDDGFVARLDSDTGQVVWARQLGGTGRQAVDSVTVDPDGNVIVGGTYRNEVKFLPGLVRLAGGTTDDCFVAWYGPTGNIWMARPLGGTGACAGRSVAAGAAGVVHFSGQFGGQIVFDPWYSPSTTTVTASSGTDGFVVTFASTDYDWHAHLGGSGSALGTAVAVDPADGDVLVGGSYSGSLIIAAPSGTSTVAPAAGWDSYVTRFASDGTLDLSGTFTLGGTGSELLSALDVSGGWIAVGGAFTSPTWTLGSSTLTLTGPSEGFAALLTPTGVPFWTREIGVANQSMLYTLDLSPNGWLALAGNFSGTVRLDDQRTLTTAGNRDGFWARIDPAP